MNIKESGFTLIELLAIITIFSIVSGITGYEVVMLVVEGVGLVIGTLIPFIKTHMTHSRIYAHMSYHCKRLRDKQDIFLDAK